MIYENKKSIILENDYAEITVSKSDAVVEKIIYKPYGSDVLKEKAPFFALVDKENKPFKLKGISLSGELITVDTEIGSYNVEVKAFPHYFSFELLSSLPEKSYSAVIASAKYDYDTEDEFGACANLLAMTYWANVTYSPDNGRKETICKVLRHLKDKGAKFALLITPINKHREALKEATLAIDKNYGVRSDIGGAFALDSRINYGNYNIQYCSNQKYFKEMLPFYVEMGLDQIDYHHGYDTFRTGDFKYVNYEDGADFKRQVTDVLAEHGMSTSLHTYTAYIDQEAEDILSKPENLKELVVNQTFTLKEDLKAGDEYIVTEESTDGIITDESFYNYNSPFVLIDDEIIRINNTDKGFNILKRASGGTKEAEHKKGAEVKYLYNIYWCFFPKLGTPLFYDIARRTAKAYNEGGYRMIYLDACEGIHHQCDVNNAKDEVFYYVGAFVTEILKNCKIDPILEGSAGAVTIWAAGGRRGAFDNPSKGYKAFVDFHTRCNLPCFKNHSTATLGWYQFYPTCDKEPGNFHTKYHHTDDVDHIGSIAVKYDFSMSYHGLAKQAYESSNGLRRNVKRFRKYDDLRKAQYFSEDYRNKLQACEHDLKLIEKRGGKFSFVETDYQKAKLYDLNDCGRNCHEFKNPFGAQTPFVRIEALLSSKGENPITVFPLDETKPISAQTRSITYPTPINLEKNLAKKVRIWGNGKKGSAVSIKFKEASGHPMMEYKIDTGFVGARDFILIESDNGERPDLKFEVAEHYWAVYGAGFNPSKTARISIELTEDAKDSVRMSSIVACEEVYEVLKNPSVKIGESEVTFECELMSSDYIEFDGKKAVAIDRFGNEKEIWWNGSLRAPRGRFKATLTAKALNRTAPRAILTFGFTGKEIK